MDKALKKISFYQQYPQYIPFVGCDYSETRVLLLGECHSFSKESTANQNPEAWYNNNNSALNEDEMRRTNTRLDVNDFIKAKSKRVMFGRIDKALKDSNFSGIQSIAFMNAFQRPAIGNGKSLKVQDNDIEQSANVINQVITILEPRYLCFFSKNAHTVLSEALNFDQSRIHVVSHPSCGWWTHKTSKGINGKEAFSKVLSATK